MSRRRPAAASACLGLAIALCSPTIGRALGADGPPSGGGALPSDPVFTALRTDGTSVSGRIQRLGPDGAPVLATEGGGEQAIPVDRLVKLSREGGPPPSEPEGAAILLPDGDRLQGVVIGAADETTLKVLSSTMGDLAVPLESLLALVLKLPPEADEAGALLVRLRSAPRESEVLWLANGDLISGGFLGLDERKVKFQPEGGAIELDRSGIVALGFDPALAVYPRPTGPFLEVSLADGSRLGVTSPRVEQGQLLATTRFGASLQVPIGEVTGIHARSASLSYLSDREASAKQYVSYVGNTRPYRRDASVTGHPLRAGGRRFEHGIGTQSRTLLAYRLSAVDRRFQATVALDDRAGPQGCAVFRVLVDGREVYASPPMTVNDTPEAIDVDLSGAKVLILATEFGPRGDVRDYADWLEARIIH